MKYFKPRYLLVVLFIAIVSIFLLFNGRENSSAAAPAMSSATPTKVIISGSGTGQKAPVRPPNSVERDPQNGSSVVIVTTPPAKPLKGEVTPQPGNGPNSEKGRVNTTVNPSPIPVHK